MRILRGEDGAYEPNTSIWWYKLDSKEEVGDPAKWAKANPNLGLTVKYDTYEKEVRQAERDPSTRNDILAKRFGIPTEVYVLLHI